MSVYRQNQFSRVVDNSPCPLQLKKSNYKRYKTQTTLMKQVLVYFQRNRQTDSIDTQTHRHTCVFGPTVFRIINVFHIYKYITLSNNPKWQHQRSRKKHIFRILQLHRAGHTGNILGSYADYTLKHLNQFCKVHVSSGWRHVNYLTEHQTLHFPHGRQIPTAALASTKIKAAKLRF